ncbi:MAG: protoglobin domain-containing protein, partial [Myxococcota bacterium]
MHTPLCQAFAIDEHSLSIRREFVDLTDADRRLLLGLIPWSERVAPQIARKFYDYQFGFEPTLRFFQKMAESKRTSVDRLRQQLESAQGGYFVEVFQGAQSNWGVEYFERRLKVGQVHDRIDLPFKWYLGSYPTYFRLTRAALRRSFWYRPGYVSAAEESILKVFNLDQQAIGDAFLLSTFRSMHFDLSSLQPAPGADRTELLGDAKRSMAAMTAALGAQVAQMASTAEDLNSLSTSINEGSTRTLSQSQTLAAASTELDAAIGEIARSAAKAAVVAA